MVSANNLYQTIREVGDYMALDLAAEEGSGFCVAAIENQGRPSADSMGHTFYSGARLKVFYHLLKGDFPARICGYSVMDLNISGKTEALPIIGKPYLMIGLIEGEIFNIQKLAEPSLENVEAVRRVMRQRKLEVNPLTFDQKVIPTRVENSTTAVPSFVGKPLPQANYDVQLAADHGLIYFLSGIALVFGGLLWRYARTWGRRTKNDR